MCFIIYLLNENTSIRWCILQWWNQREISILADYWYWCWLLCFVHLQMNKIKQEIPREWSITLHIVWKCHSNTAAHTWCLSQVSGISGLPLSLSTLSFMLSTQGCSRTLEPYAGSYSFISVNTNTGHGLVIDCKSTPSTNYRRYAFFMSFCPYHHVSVTAWQVSDNNKM